MSTLDRLIAKFTRVTDWFLRVGFVTLLAMVVIDTVNITSLKLGFGNAIPSGKEMMEELMVVTTYCGVAFVLLRQEHIRTELMEHRFPAKVRVGTKVLRHLIAAGIAFLLLWRSIILVQGTAADWSLKQGLINIPLFPSQFLMSVSFFLLFCAALLILVREIVGGGKTRAEAEKVADST